MCDLCIRNSAHNYNCFLHYDKRRIFVVSGFATQQWSSLDEDLDQVGLKYSTYTYWSRKFRFSPSAEDDVPFAQVSLRTSSDATLPVHTGNITLQFPNGVRVCLESGMEET